MDEGELLAVARWTGAAFAEALVAVAGDGLLSLSGPSATSESREAAVRAAADRVMRRARAAFAPESARVVEALIEERWGCGGGGSGDVEGRGGGRDGVGEGRPCPAGGPDPGAADRRPGGAGGVGVAAADDAVRPAGREVVRPLAGGYVETGDFRDGRHRGPSASRFFVLTYREFECGPPPLQNLRYGRGVLPSGEGS